MPQQILHLVNEYLGIDLNEDFSATLFDGRSGQEWSMIPTCYQEIGPLSESAVWNRRERCYMDRYPSYFSAVKRDDGSVRVTVLDPLRNPRGSFACTINLDREWIRFCIDAVDERLPSLIFPPYIESESLVIPSGLGVWHRSPISEAQFIMPAAGWNMRWFGGLRGENGWMALVEDGFADSGVYMSQFAACAGWQKSLGKWGPKRSLKIAFTENGYVGMARKFRKYARDNNLYRSLSEKIEEHPAAANLIGGRCMSFFQGYTYHKENSRLRMTPYPPDAGQKDGNVQVLVSYSDVKSIVNEAQAAGMKRGYFNLRGWTHGGYDETHPDIWPPEPHLGSLEELREILSTKDPFIAVLHDNYQDIYSRVKSFPEWVMKNPDGRLREGGTWLGGRCYIINPEKALMYVKRNWEYLKTVNCRGMFLDTIGASHFQEDFSPEHPSTRTMDFQSKLEVVRFLRSQGNVVGTECESDFSISEMDFVETRTTRVPGVSIPLWQLAYHDAAVTLRYTGGPSGQGVSGNDAEDLLWGYAKMWYASSLAAWRDQLDRFKASLRVDRLHARIGLDDMINHRYLNTEGTIEQTEFSSGISVLANFSDQPFSAHGKMIDAGDCVILD